MRPGVAILRSRRGVALPLALFTLVIAAVMITAVFYVGRLEQRMGYNSIAATQAFEAAETGMAAVLTSWVPATFNSMASGATIALPPTAVGANAVYTVTIRRLNNTLFLIQAEGRFLIGGQAVTRRQLARVARLDPPEIDPAAALTTRWDLEIKDNALVNGRDSVPTSWGGVCPPPGAVAPAVIDSAGATTTTGPCTGQVCLTGSPTILTNPSAANHNTFNDFGDETFASLSGVAEKVFPSGTTLSSLGPTTAGATCLTSDPQNWGDPLDPTSPCGEYFPVIWAPGNLTLSGGWGQGILLVDGSLTLSGGVQFYGVIVVLGSINATGGQVIGATMVENEFALPGAQIGGTSQLYFSRCAITRAVSGSARPRAMRERSWVQLY